MIPASGPSALNAPFLACEWLNGHGWRREPKRGERRLEHGTRRYDPRTDYGRDEYCMAASFLRLSISRATSSASVA